MTRLSVILLSIVLISGSLFAQDTDSKVELKKLTPELKRNFSDILKEKFISPSALKERNDEIKAVPFTLTPVDGSNPLDAKSLKNITQSKKPLALPPDIQAKRKELFDDKKGEKKSPTLQGQMTQLPQNIRYVGEFEESQAVMLAVPCTPWVILELEGIGQNGVAFDLFTTNFENYAYYYFPTIVQALGIQFSSQDEANQYYNYCINYYYIECKPGDAILWPALYCNNPALYNALLSVLQLPANYFMPVPIPKNYINWLSCFYPGSGIGDTTQSYIWANLANAIQQEAEVWIRMTAILDTTYMKDYMSQKGMPLTNYRFFYESNGEDAFWARDWGPHGFYYNAIGNQTKLGFHDAVYYTGRQYDDVFPRKLLDEVDYNWYDLQIKMEGGNIMTDGWGDATYGDVIYRHNSSYYSGGQLYQPNGQYYYDEATEKWYLSTFTGMDATQVNAKMKEAFNMNNPNLVKSLAYDGGTGHIDLWIKQFDEETMLIADMPNKYSGLTDYQRIQANRAYLSDKKTTFGTDYRFLNAPMPKRLDGPYPTSDGDMPTSDSLYNLDPRGYLNGLLVNKSYIYPSFSRGPSDPCWQNDEAAREVLKKLLPGYKLVPIDSRTLTVGGGAIHCITMQIPQDPSKLITIKHKPIRGALLGLDASLSAELISNTDANKLVAYWKKIKDNVWQTMEMTTTDNKVYNTTIIGDDWVTGDTIRYYIAAQKDNEVRKCSPITGGQGANDGYYEFYISDIHIDELYGYEPKGGVIASVYPNPASDYVNIVFENATEGNVTIEILNSLGQTIMTPINKYFHKGVFIFDIKDLDLVTGIYFIKMTTDTGISVKNFVVK